MKKLTILTAILVIMAMSASAQMPKPFTVYADLGITVPNGDFNLLYKPGMHVGAGVGFNVAPMFQIVPSIEYHSFKSDLLGLGGGDMTVWMLGANGRLALAPGPIPLKPFFLGGVGMARGSVEAIQLLGLVNLPSSTSTNFYWNIGAGLEMSSLFFQARYVSIGTDGGSTNYMPLTVGFKF